MATPTQPDPRPSPFRGRWLLLTVAVVVLALLFVRLGTWQLERRAEKREANARLLARMEAPALVLDGSTITPDEADLRRGQVSGVYDFENEVLLRNRTLNELPGVHAITPLRIAGSGAAILVDRGWIPYELSAPDQRAVFQEPEGIVAVTGILRRSQERSSGLSPADPPLTAGQERRDAWHRVDIPRIQEQVPYPLLPVFLEAESTQAGSPAPRFPRPDPRVSLAEGSHLFYAIQWLAFTVILLTGYALVFRARAGR